MVAPLIPNSIESMLMTLFNKRKVDKNVILFEGLHNYYPKVKLSILNPKKLVNGL